MYQPTDLEIAIMEHADSGDLLYINGVIVRVTSTTGPTPGIVGLMVMGCEWFARCAQDATELVPHPSLGPVAVCATHAAFAGYSRT
jgi:hypothetical protein